MGGLGITELLIILTIVIVLFGASRLAGIGAALGQSVSEFRKGVKDDAAPPVGVPTGQDARHDAPLR